MNTKKIIDQELFTFNDVLIVPRFSTISSRQDVDLSTKLGKLELKLPIICANMDTIVSSAMCHALAAQGAIGTLHRFFPTIEDNVKFYKDSIHKNTKPIASIGITHKEFERAEALIAAGCEIICIDVANGAQMGAVKMYDKLREKYQDSIGIIIGNFATAESIHAFKHHMKSIQKVDAFKAGIGGGCFAAGTRILMDSGQYKNIEEVRVGDEVINKDGKAVKVIGTKNSGIKKVIKYRTNNFYEYSYATPDHQHYVGDHSTIKDINDVSLVKVLDQLTKNDESKFKWKRLDETDKTVCLLPKIIKFNLPETFRYSLKDYSVMDSSFLKMNYIENFISTYELGYVFGTFLGDGNIHKKTSSNSGNVAWTFGLSEIKIATKLSNCLKDVFNINAKIVKIKNTIKVLAYCLPLFHLFESFGKRINKSLPEKYLCKDLMYLKGLYDGLIDSDGCYHKDGRIELLNTSKSIIELFMFLFKTIEGYYPSIQTREPSVGGLTNINIENCHKSYVARSVINPDNLLANDYQVVRIHEKELQSIEVETYDIEVDCPTHSFIANNVIVHNSACLTRVKAGVGIPQLSAVLDCVSTGENIISDGGHKTASDVCKALAAGAKAVMIGGMFAGTEECPGEIITTEAGKKFKKYRGSASEESYQVQGKASKWRAAEGDSFLVEYKGPVEGILLDIEGGIRSSMTYVDSKSLDEYVEKAQMVRVSASTVAENGAHGKK